LSILLEIDLSICLEGGKLKNTLCCVFQSYHYESVQSYLMGIRDMTFLLHDQDYALCEFQKMKHRCRSRINIHYQRVGIRDTKVPPHIQYFILHQYITNPKFWNRDLKKNSNWISAPNEEVKVSKTHFSWNLNLIFIQGLVVMFI
jgi:hypothetical protein